jgi:hypothetical protein
MEGGIRALKRALRQCKTVNTPEYYLETKGKHPANSIHAVLMMKKNCSNSFHDEQD